MKGIDELINEIPVNRANFEHIAKTGKINGNLFIDLKRMIEQNFNPKLEDFEPLNPLEHIMTDEVKSLLEHQREQRKFNK